MSDVSVSIQITNLGAFKRAFASAPHIVAPHLDRAIKKAVASVGRRSRQLTPVDTGHLRASTRETFRPLHGEVGTHTNYDIFVHEGTRYMKARPYLRDAVQQVEPAINNIFVGELQQALDKIARMT